MKTAISIPDPLFEAAERLARQLGYSRSQLYQHAVRDYIQRHRHSVVRETLDEVYGSDGEEARVDPVLEHLQAASLEDGEW